ncbi:MAG TPA: glutamate--cysteine ligase, partial [Anaeromyxobacteraceae bacterium]|nr:glutamate--cysteine ligase [Anaeromyxobacteraceae bacterium]
MSLDAQVHESPRVRDAAELGAWFRRHERPRAGWKIGLEHEKVAIRAGSREPIPYEGPRGVAALLRGFGRWEYEP